jgi:hypothetical protein
MLRLRSCLKLRKVNRRSVRCAGLTHEIVRMVEGWVVEECEALCRTYANNNRPRLDNSVVANPYTSLNNNTVTNVNVLANVDLLRNFSAIFAF